MSHQLNPDYYKSISALSNPPPGSLGIAMGRTLCGADPHARSEWRKPLDGAGDGIQAALHGLLRKIRDLGLPLLAVTRILPNQVDAQK